MDQYWNRWAKELRTLTEPYEGMYDPRISSEFPEEHLLKYYKCLNRLMQPLELLEENLECPGEMLLENYAHLEANLESLATKHPWFSEDESTQDVIELLEVLTTRREIKKEFFEEKITGLDKRIGVTHLVVKTKHMRACQEDYALDSLVLHATVFLFNCVSPRG